MVLETGADLSCLISCFMQRGASSSSSIDFFIGSISSLWSIGKDYSTGACAAIGSWTGVDLSCLISYFKFINTVLNWFNVIVVFNWCFISLIFNGCWNSAFFNNWFQLLISNLISNLMHQCVWSSLLVFGWVFSIV